VPVPTLLSELSALGWLVMFSGFGVVAGNLFSSTWGKRNHEANPWGASSPEWTVGSPPPVGNFEESAGS